MDLKAWNPWQELERIQSEMDAHLGSVLKRLRQAVPGRPIAFLPSLDVIETADDYKLYLALPGMVEEDIDITLEGRRLIVRGERESPYDPGAVTVHQGQWQYGFFERQVELPDEVSADDVQAAYEGGVLTITVPKRAASPAEEKEDEGAAT
jgi:HSP20 family protein